MNAPLPPRDATTSRAIVDTPIPRGRDAMVMTIVFFVIGLSLILSYDWGSNPPAFRPDTPLVVLFAVLVAAIVYIGFRYGSRMGPVCPACGRTIPADAILCPYCGQRRS